MPHKEGITELLGQEFGPVDGRRENREPCSGLFSSLDSAASPIVKDYIKFVLRRYRTLVSAFPADIIALWSADQKTSRPRID